jgi:hypothetical protein
MTIQVQATQSIQFYNSQNATITSLNKIWRLSRRIRKISAEYCNDRQNYEQHK